VVAVKPDDWVRIALCPERRAAQTICDEPFGDFHKLFHRARVGVGIYQVGDPRWGSKSIKALLSLSVVATADASGQMAYDDTRHPP
jgi:hypothetical protein